MLKKRKNVRKIIVLLISIISIISLGINLNKVTKEKYNSALNLYNASETINIDKGEIDPIYRPKWEKVSSSFSAANKTLTVVVKGSAYENKTIDANTQIKYASDVISTLSASNVKVFIDGIEVTSTTNPTVKITDTKTSTNTTSGKKEVTHTIQLSNLEEAVRQAGKNYKEWSGNIALKITGRGQDESTYSSNVLTDDNGNHSMMEIQEDGTWVNVELKDTKTDHNTDNVMFADYIKPEFTYVYAAKDIDHTNKTLTIDFSITDKYFDSTKLITDTNGTLTANQSIVNQITVAMKDDATTAVNTKVTKKITNIQYITEKRNNENVRIGAKFTLVIGNLQQETSSGNYRDYSGPMSITFPKEIASDKSKNQNDAKTITIGIGEPSNSGSQQIVDVVDPVWRVENLQKTVNSTTGKLTATMDIYGTDKYFKQSTLTADQIQLWVDGVNITASGSTAKISRTLTKVKDFTEQRDGKTVTYGIHYKYTITDLEEADALFNAERAKYAANTSTGRAYREYSGDMSIVIPANTMVDDYTNTNKALTYSLGHIDSIKPEIIKISSTRDATNKKETFVFDVVDKYIASSALGTTVTEANNNKSKVHVFVDGEAADSVTKNYTSVTPLSAKINGTSKVVGYRYTLELTGFEKARTAINFNREYSDWSGNVTLEIDAGVAKDTANNFSVKTVFTGDFVDFIKPNATYQYATADIDHTDKTFTMVFDVTDKFYSSGTLAIGDLTIKIDGKDVDWNKVSKSLTVADRQNTVKITENGVVKSVTKTIGKRYTLELSNLEQIQTRDTSGNYISYSGVVTVAIPGSKISDTGVDGQNTSPNKNDGTTITSGINIPGGSGTGQVVDVVDPLVERLNSSANAVNKTTTVKFNITDKYYDATKDALTQNDMKVLVNGTEVTGKITGFSTKALTESKTTNGTTSQVQYGVEYTVTISNFDTSANQVLLRIPQGKVIDQYGNSNKQTDLILYNVLKSAELEADATSVFLGGKIQRQNIENITFEKIISSAVYNHTTKKITDTTRAWDVSAQGDQSIVAWYVDSEKNANGMYKIHIANNNVTTIAADLKTTDVSNSIIYANQNSTQLFSYIGYATGCTATTTITNLSLLNTTSVTNMYRMFRGTGYTAMTKLDLGAFDTSNVTNMSAMFETTGFKAMQTLNLGTSFKTNKVTNMAYMFNACGETALESLDLGTNFNSSEVTNMHGMFRRCGHSAMTSINLRNMNTSKVTNMAEMFYETGKTKLTTLDLGTNFNTSKVTNMSAMFTWMGALTTLNLRDKFDTSNVTDMHSMFWGTGCSNMTSFSLGDKFNTGKVTDMSGMFYDFAHKISKLDLGDNFYTTSATNMTNMFYQAGQTAMTVLDLGPAFTKIADTRTNMFYNTGKSGNVVYASEQIYLDKNNFKLNTSVTTSAINYTRGTINPRYRTEWIKQSSQITIDSANPKNSKITITLRGRTNAEAGKEFTSNVTSSLTQSQINDQIKVFIDGKEATTITKTIGNATADTNATTGASDVVQVLTITNFQEAARQSGKSYKEWSGNISLKIAKKTLTDTKYSNQNLSAIDTTGTMTDIVLAGTGTEKQNDTSSTSTMFTDFVKPEFNYISSETTINHDTKTVTILFSVRDKYFSTSGLTADTTASKISVTVADEDVNSKITKKLEIAEEEKDVINGKNQKVGEKYRLTITGLDHKDGTHYSGIMQLGFAKDLVVDLSGNKNDAQTITIGVDTPNGSGSGSIVDVVDPVWNTQNFTIDKTNKKITVDLIGTDKYYLSDSLTTDKIKVFVDGKEASSITKQLSDSSSVTNGVKYTLTLSGWEETSEQTENIYKEWSGITKIQIAAGTLKDKYTNTSKQHEFTLGHVDFIKPVIKKASSSKNATNGTETILFNVIDKYLDTTSTLSANDITVYVDKVEATGLTKTLTKTSTQFTASINGSTQVVGQQYQLVLSGFKQARSSIDSTKNYTEWSGTVSIDVAAGKIKDKIVSPNTTANTNNQTTIYGDFVDFIKPEITYKYAASDINYTNKTFTMDFEITDKYFNSITELTTQNITQYVTIKVDGVDITNNTAITKEIISTTNVTAGTTAKPINKTVNGTVQTGLTNQVIGRHYKLRISGLQQAIKTGNTLDYSGVITVAFKEGIATDTTTNKNAATTITSGVNLPGGSGSGTIVDVVDPMWEQIGRASVEAGKGTASMVIRGTDKYLNKVTSALTSGKITVTVNGTTPTTTVTVNVQEDTSISETWAKQYKVTLTGFDPKAYQVAFKIPAGVLVDGYGNTSKEKEFILFSSLKKTNTETASTSLFLGITGVQRQNVEQVIFEEYIDDSKTLFDVSAAQDRTIMAWYEKTSRNTYIVHIGSTIIINGNQDSTNLFNYVGYSTNCAVTNEASNKIIKNIELLHVDNVTNMKNMFAYLGYGKMQTFSLGSAFDTTNVTDMSGMFQYTGFAAMTSIDLAGKFNTINVTKMNSMFDHTGYTAMTGLNLGGKFNTAKVTEMSSMFADTGYTKMTTLNLGGEFSTLKVTKMDWMFKNCGHEALTALNLGSKFNTSIVQTMEGMFNATGYKAMVSLDLGDNFYTSTVTNMDNMFNSTGAVSMMALDMGPNFKKIAAKHVNFATNCGKKDVVIYAPEVIYSTQTSFKLGI